MAWISYDGQQLVCSSNERLFREFVPKSAYEWVEKALTEALATASCFESQEQGNFELPPLSPWGLWLFFCLVRHEQRQEWVGEIAQTNLGVDLNLISRAVALGHPPIDQSGLVPGLSDWEYYLHGRGIQLTNRLSGEAIDVDFHDGAADYFDEYFFHQYLRSLKKPEFCEQRLMALHPTLDSLSLSFDELLESELIVSEENSCSTRLRPPGRTKINRRMSISLTAISHDDDLYRRS